MTKDVNSFITPSPSRTEAGEGFIELTPRNKETKSRLFKKHILNKGPLFYPGIREGKIDIDDDFISTLKRNFDNGVCDIVQVPLANDKNQHTEDPDRNIGEVVGIEEVEGKVYAIIDARDEERARKLGSTILGASAQFSLNYTDTHTGEKVGPTLMHVAATNRPYVTGLEEYEEIIAATADSKDEVVLLTPTSNDVVSEQTPTKKEEPRVATLTELMTELKLSHNVDVNALQDQVVALTADAAKVAPAEEAVASLTEQVASLTAEKADLESQVESASPAQELLVKLSQALVESEVVSLSAGESLDADGVLGAIAGIVEEKVALAAQVKEASDQAAALEVEGLVREGRILPAQKEAMLELRLSNPEMFEKLVPEKPLVALSQEEGTDVTDSDLNPQESEIDQEVARLTAPGGPAAATGYLAPKE